MSENNRTSLGLHAWASEEKPVRLDFVGDNQLLDQLLTAHFSDNTRHRNTADAAPMAVGHYVGNGAEQQSVALPFPPRAVLVFRRNFLPLSYRSPGGELAANCAFVTSEMGTAGIQINGAVLTVLQDNTTDTATVHNGMNFLNGEYAYIAIR